MDLASVVAALASVGVRVSGSTPNNNVQGDSSRACPTGLAGPEPSGTINDPGQHFQAAGGRPGGGTSCLGVGRPGSGALPPPTARPLGGLLGPTTHWLWVRGGAGGGTRHQPHSARSCMLSGRHEGAQGGRLLPGCGAFGVGRSPTPDCPPSGRAAGAHYPLAVGAGGCGRGDPSPTPQRDLLRAGFARCGGGMRVPGGGASCLGVGRPGSGALPPPTARPLGGLLGPTTHWLWVRGGACVGTRHQPHSARSCELALRAGGGGTRASGGGASCLGVGRPGSGALPPPTTRPFGRAAGARFPLAVAAVCRRGGPAVLGTLSRAAVRRVLCALPGFAAPGGRCGLAPVLVPWLWPAVCLSGVPRGPALVRRSLSGPVALGAPVGFPAAVVPSPTPGAVAPGFTGWLRGARGGRPINRAQRGQKRRR